MDQESFRRLLSTSSKASSSATNRYKTISASEPAFKPRKVKKSDSQYRDRAAERRDGQGIDYSQVESVLEDLEARNASQPEQSANANADAEDDDDALESAFQEASAPKKKTRDEIMKELRESRQAASAENKEAAPSSMPQSTPVLDSLKATSKFKPIGFKPIGAASAKGEKKKKKKKKVMEELQASHIDTPAPIQSAPTALVEPQPRDEPEEDLDIFAGVEEYKGFDSDNDDGEVALIAAAEEEPSRKGKGWFKSSTDEQDTPSVAALAVEPVALPPSSAEAEEEEGEVSMKLVPLAGSSMPSIKDILAMDDAAAAQDKKRKRKDKNKEKGDGEGDMSAEHRAERDYKRLKSYTDSRGK